jgi:hypothetical protein
MQDASLSVQDASLSMQDASLSVRTPPLSVPAPPLEERTGLHAMMNAPLLVRTSLGGMPGAFIEQESPQCRSLTARSADRPPESEL